MFYMFFYIIKFCDIDKKYNLKVGSSRLALSKPHRCGEEALAKVLNIPLKELFPSRYDENGKRLSIQNYVYEKLYKSEAV